MYLSDFHTHSCCSPDSEATLLEMAQAAARVGITDFCTTDHLDLQTMEGALLEEWDWGPILRQYRETVPNIPGVHLHLGIELGGAYVNPQWAEELLRGIPLDFVIGSVHNTSPEMGNQDFYYMDFTDDRTAMAVMDDYVRSLMKLAALKCYDCLGHIIYPLRYVNHKGIRHVTLEPWRDEIDEVLRTVIGTDRAIEFNTHNGREIEEWIPLLRRYRELGGKLITLGSDAHRPENVGKGLKEAVLILQRLGFQQITIFQNRQPRLIPIS